MKKIIFVLFSLFLSINSFALEKDNRIIGGENVIKDRYNWVAGVYLSPRDNNSHYIYCGGALVSKDIVLTAAHCVKGRDPNTLRVSVGRTDKFDIKEGEFIHVDNIITHPKYNSDVYHNDIAMLKLTEKTSYEPISIANDEVMNFVNKADSFELFRAFGWGKTEDSISSSLLKAVDLDHFTRNECNAFWSDIVNSQICIGNKVFKDRNTCRGDSGGPVTVNYNNQRWLVGTTSYGTENCLGSNLISVYTKISKYRNWIESNTNDFVNLDLKIEDLSKSEERIKKIKLIAKNKSFENIAYNVFYEIENIDNILINNRNCTVLDSKYRCYLNNNLSVGETDSITLDIESQNDTEINIPLVIKAKSGQYNYNGSKKILNLSFNKEYSLNLSNSVQKNSLEDLINVEFLVRNNSNLKINNLQIDIIKPNYLFITDIENLGCFESSTKISCNIKNEFLEKTYDINLLSVKDDGLLKIDYYLNNQSTPFSSEYYVNFLKQNEIDPKKDNSLDESGSSSGGGSLGYIYLLLLSLIFYRK